MTYNGYENWATWATTLMLTNDQGTYDAVVELLRGTRLSDRSTVLQEWVEEAMIPEDVEGLAGSYISHAFAQVNWNEVVAYCDEDLKPECADCGATVDLDEEEERCETCRDKRCCTGCGDELDGLRVNNGAILCDACEIEEAAAAD